MRTALLVSMLLLCAPGVAGAAQNGVSGAAQSGVSGAAKSGVSVAAQSGVSGIVRDSRGQSLSDAEVQVQSESTGARWKTRTDDEGRYSAEGLPAGRYKVTCRAPGFRTAARSGISIEEGARQALDFSMELLGLHEVITVESGRESGDPSAGDSLVLSRDGPGAALPANGRDYRMLFDLMPGIVVTPAAVSDAGQFASNGQRPNSNSFRVDGVSANSGVGGSSLPGSLPGASLPAMTAIGTTENLGSPEATQSVELRTSAFAPESGERPGAAALVTTRSGTNEYHGEFYGHVRDNGWAARDWFANSRGLDFPRPYYRSLGGVFGGPILRNRTFVFGSAEKSSLSDEGLALAAVPSVAARQNAPESLASILNGFPLPSGEDLGGGEAVGLAPLGKSAIVKNVSVRVDQSLGSHGTLFGRVVESVSNSLAGYLNANQGRMHWRSETIGLTAGPSGGVIHDLRFNSSRSEFVPGFAGSPWFYAFYLAGLIPIPPPLYAAEAAAFANPMPPRGQTIFGISIPGLGQFVGGGADGRTRQDQWELRDTASRQMGAHQLRAGIDWVRLMPWREAPVTTIVGAAPSLQSLLDGQPLALAISQAPQSGGYVHTVSLFAQDTWRLAAGLTVVYGLRWEVTPPAAVDLQIPTVTGLWSGTDFKTTYTGDINGAGPWPMRFGQVAPRVGVAWSPRGSRLVLRAGAGVFFDTALGAAISPVNGAPFNSWQMGSGATGIGLSSGGSDLLGGSSNGADVSQFLLGPAPPLRLPTSYQWKLSLEKNAGAGGVLSVAYLGAMGRHLLGNQAYVDPATAVLTRFTTLTLNSSNYEALEVRHSGSFGRGIYGSASYTWSHSIDDGSQDSSVFLIHPGYRLSEARASSSFDVRQALTAALSYRIPRRLRLPDALAGWTVSGVFRARGGFPIDIRTSEEGLGRGFDNVGRPDLVAGVPQWIGDPTVAGGRRLNPAAFAVPPPGTAGTLGRNAIAGFGLAQFDASLRREFAVYGRVSAEVGLGVFNVLNHPAFADPVAFRSSPFFGQSTSMQNLMLGSGTPNTGLPALFQTGGARTAEVSFRVSF